MRSKKNPTVEISKNIEKAIKSNINSLESLKANLRKSYPHDCTADSEGKCSICDWVSGATYVELLAKIKEFEDEKEEITLDHIMGDEPDYEPPTPSDGEDAKENFSNDPHDITSNPF